MTNLTRICPVTATIVLGVALTLATGCNRTANPDQSSAETPVQPTSTNTVAGGNSDEAESVESSGATERPVEATHQFHRDKEFTEVTADMASGSVDHIHLDGDANPFVVVVVKVTTEAVGNPQFRTSFLGDGHYSQELVWQPGDSSDNQFIAVFVVSAAAKTATTTFIE